MSALKPRRRAQRAARLPTQRRQLEAALEAALSVVEAALALLDTMDGDADLEPSCEDEGHDSDSEPDDDREPSLGAHEGGAGGSSWSAVSGYGVAVLDGEEDGRTRADVRRAQARVTLYPRRWGGFDFAQGPAVWVRASALLDPDDAPDPLQPPSYGYGCAR